MNILHVFLAFVLLALSVAFGIDRALWPLIFSVLALLALYENRRDPGFRVPFVLSVLFTLYFLFSRFQMVFVPLFFGILLAFLLDPVVSFLRRRARVPRAVSALVLLLVFLFLMLGLVGGLTAQALSQAASLLSSSPEMLQQIFNRLNHFLQETGWLARIGPIDLQEEFFRQLAHQVSQLPARAFSVVNVFVFFLLTLVVAFYLLVDLERLTSWAGRMARQLGVSPRLLQVAGEIQHILHRYFRGQILDATAVGLLTGIALALLHVRFATLLGVLAGVMNLVPTLGFWISFAPALLVGLMEPSPLVGVLKVSAVYGGVQALESSFLGPRIIGGSVGLHPLVIFFALIIGAELLGVLGMLLAVPTAALLKSLLEAYWPQEKEPETADSA